jgi:hypothetical protein
MDTHRENATPDGVAPVGPVAGETLKDAARWPGHTLIAIGLVAFALSLCGYAIGRSGLATVGVGVTVVALAAGLSWLFVEHRRRASGLAPERPEDTAPL